MVYYTIEGYLSNYGFCIKKEKININILNILKKYFSVKPELNYEDEDKNNNDKYFNVYYEDDIYIILPKFSKNIIIFINNINNNNILINDIEYNKIIFKIKKIKYKKTVTNFNFSGKLRDYQQTIINEIFNKFNLDINNPTKNQLDNKNIKGGIIKLSCGGGKCLGKDTPVLMFNGSIKLVQNIIINDKLMGDDSNPRNILKITKGNEKMYKINIDNNDSYIVNSSHILSLVNIDTNEIIDININDYLNLINNNHIFKYQLYGFRVKINFKEKPISIDPYIVGLLCSINYNNFEPSIINYYNFIEENNIINKPNIPLNYKANIDIIQLQVLAGIIDLIGIINYNNITIKVNNFELYNDIIFIARSLCINLNKNIIDHSNNIFELVLFGNNILKIPLQNLEKKINIFNTHQFNNKIKNLDIEYTSYKITVTELKLDDYYGFEIDGNRRFILGDFTVTHNTVLAIYLSWILKLKTLIVVHKEFLMDQWIERFSQYTDAKIGIIRQKKIDIQNKDVVIAMLRSLSIKDYPAEVFQQFGLVIYDEVHHLGSKIDSRALLKTSAEYTIGLSATPERSDGMTKIINWHIGDILYSMDKKYNYRVLVKKIFFRSEDKLFKEIKRWFQHRLAPNHVAMTEAITNIKTRNQLIVNIIDVLKGMGRKILILSYRVEHLELLKKMVDEKIKNDGESHIYNSYFYMGKTKKGEKKMAEKDGDIIYATMQLAEEGLDISHLDTILFALPVSIQMDKKRGKIKSSKTLIQSIGRILRNDKLEVLTQIPMVIDISDLFSIYSGWSTKRNEIYEKKNWYLQNYYWNDLEYIYKSTDDKQKNPMNLIFNDISDEDFIENNLLVNETDAKIMEELDNNDLIINDSLNNNIKKEKNIIKENIYKFGKKNYNFN